MTNETCPLDGADSTGSALSWRRTCSVTSEPSEYPVTTRNSSPARLTSAVRTSGTPTSRLWAKSMLAG